MVRHATSSRLDVAAGVAAVPERHQRLRRSPSTDPLWKRQGRRTACPGTDNRLRRQGDAAQYAKAAP